MRLGHPLEQVAREMDPAIPPADPAAALEHPPDGAGKPLVGIADYRLKASEAASLNRNDEVAQEGLGFADPDFEAHSRPWRCRWYRGRGRRSHWPPSPPDREADPHGGVARGSRVCSCDSAAWGS